MNGKKSFVPLMTFVLALAVEMAFLSVWSAGAIANQSSSSSNTSTQSNSGRRVRRVNFNPPDRGAPPATVGLGSREGTCVAQGDASFSALVPSTLDTSAEIAFLSLEYTTASHPTFLIYVPTYSASAQMLSLRLMQVMSNGQEAELYTQSFTLPISPGIVSLSTADSTLPALQIGQQYHWYASLVCSSVDQSGNAIAEGLIERIEPDSALVNVLAQADPLDRAALYGQAGIWQDTLFTLAELRRAQPNNVELQATWHDLLASVGLGAIADAPLLDCCQPNY
jgi:hypothetical protein